MHARHHGLFPVSLLVLALAGCGSSASSARQGSAPASAGDPLDLIGTEGFLFVRVDATAIRQHALGPAVQAVVDVIAPLMFPGERATLALDILARTDTAAFAVGSDDGRLLIRGRYSDADLAFLGTASATTRGRHTIHTAGRAQMVIVPGGQYLAIAEAIDIGGMLDLLDGGTVQPSQHAAAAQTMRARESYLSVLLVPDANLRRELASDQLLASVQADVLWAGLSLTAGGSGAEALGRVETNSAEAAQEVLVLAQHIKAMMMNAFADRPGLVAPLEEAQLTTQGSSARATWSPSNAQIEALLGSIQ